MAKRFEGPTPLFAVLDEIADWSDSTVCRREDWSGFRLHFDDTPLIGPGGAYTRATSSTRIHEIIERGGVDPDEAKKSIEEFAARMRATMEPDVYRTLDRMGYFDPPPKSVTTSRTITGKFVLDEGLTMFDEGGTITFGIDPAKPADSEEFVDTIAPLESLDD